MLFLELTIVIVAEIIEESNGARIRRYVVAAQVETWLDLEGNWKLLLQQITSAHRDGINIGVKGWCRIVAVVVVRY